jgi:hypothetical protein
MPVGSLACPQSLQKLVCAVSTLRLGKVHRGGWDPLMGPPPPTMDAPVQYTVLAEIPATNLADAHSAKKFGLHQPRPSPDSPSSVTGSSTTATTHTASSCVPRPRRPVRPRFRASLRRLRRHVQRRGFRWARLLLLPPPPPSLPPSGVVL